MALDNARLYDRIVESEREYDTILRHMRLGVITVDTELRLRLLNPTACLFFELKSEEWRGKSVAWLASEFVPLLRRALNPAEVPEDVLEITLERNKRQISLGIRLSCLYDARKQVSGALLVFEDLTQQKQLESEVRRMDRLASTGTLAAGVAHEIKNPLVSIQTFAQLLPERGQDPDFQQEFSKVVTDEIERINQMVQNLMYLAHPPGRRNDRGATPMRQTLEKVLQLLEYPLRKQGIRVVRDYPETAEELTAKADPGQVYQVLHNLIQNAMQAMENNAPDSAILTISLRKARRRIGGNRCVAVVVRVLDTGPGIAPEDLPHIFDPFYTTKEEGHGLGLSICHTIVREYGGDLEARNRADTRGSEFTMVLPAAAAAGKGDAESAPLS